MTYDLECGFAGNGGGAFARLRMTIREQPPAPALPPVGGTANCPAMPVVSVLMACHRDTPFLRPALASVLGQTLRDLELVLVDNGAGLDPATLGEAGRDPRLRWIRLSSNQGIPAAHNAAVAAAQGEFIALLDHDDVMLPTRLEKQVAWLRAEPTRELVSSLAETIDADGRVTGREFALVSGEDQRRYSEFAAPVVTPAYTGRRRVFSDLPYRAEFSLTADFDFLARAAEQFGLGAVPEVLLQYRRHAAQTTVEHANRIAAERCAVRLLTARRRAGKKEGQGGSRLKSVAQNPVPEAEILMRYARRFLSEGFPVQAAWHARRSVAVRPWGFFSALGLLAQIQQNAEAECGLARQMFWRGPVKALGVKPG
jgi:glycosyltransferase involved in cell wall biosynthesis